MAADKLQKDRYYKLDECFRNTMRKWSHPLLLDTINQYLADSGKAGIKLRSLQDDLKYLKEVEGAPIESYQEGRKHFFRYSDPNFSIRDKPLGKEDEKNLRKAINILRQLKGLSIADELADTIQRLEHKVELDNELTSNTLQFEQNLHYTGREWFGDVYELLLHQKVMKLTYQPFEADEPRTFHVHPYLLKQYNQRWFLIGWCQEHASIGTYPLDRFVDARVSNIPFEKHATFNPDFYDKYLLGVTVPPNAVPEKLMLKFAPKRVKYFLTKPFGVIDNLATTKTGHIQVTLTMIINPELEAAILQFGKDVTVVEPLNLRERIAGILKEGLGNYAKQF